MPRPPTPPSARPRAATVAALGLLALVLSSACAIRVPGAPADSPPPDSFADYQHATQAQLRARRDFQTADPQAELAWNGPREWRPEPGKAGAASRGILLVHGLGDSPWSFNDVGQALAAQGFLVRTVLLPGHGTRPEDLLEASLEQWRDVVREQAAILGRDVDHVYLGGFSTGANLVLEYAYAQPAIAGLLLFSPAFRSNSGYDWLAPLVGWARPWLMATDGQRPAQNAVRYLTVPTHGFAQFYYSSRAVQQHLRARAYDRPVFMAVARHDSVLDTAYLLSAFQDRFTHPASRLIWYGAPPDTAIDPARVLIRPDSLPSKRISRFSHMGLLFAPANPLYGEQGLIRMCRNGQDPDATRACEQGAPVWYADWGYREPGKIHARLTFNPYFDWQASVMASVLGQH